MSRNRELSVRASLAWSYGAHVLIFAVTLGGMAYVSRLLTPRELGIFGVGFAAVGVLNAVTYHAVSNFIVRERELTGPTVATCFTINAIISMASSALLLSLAYIGKTLFSSHEVPQVLRVLSVMPLLGMFELVPSSMMTRDMRFGGLSIVLLGKAAVNALVMIASALAGARYMSPAFGAVAGAAFGAVAFSIVGWRDVCLRWSLDAARAVIHFTIHMLFAGGIPIVAARVAELVIAQLLGLAALGVYTRASHLAAIVWDGAYGLSTKVIYVSMAQEMRETGSLREIYLGATRMLSAIMWPAMAGMAVLSGPIIYQIYGSQWGAAALPLALIMGSQCIAISYAMTWELCVLTERTHWQARVETMRTLVGLSFLAAGALVSLPLATVGRIIDALAGMVFYRPHMAAMAHASSEDVSEAYSGNLVLAGVAIAPAAAVMAVNGWDPELPVAVIFAAIASGAMLWFLLLAATRHPLFHEARRLTIAR